MGLFGKKKDTEPVAQRMPLEARPDTPKADQLVNYLATSAGGYSALDGKKLAESPMSKEERDIWHELRTVVVGKAMAKLKIRDRHDGVGYLVRDERDPGAIWLEVNGVRVDRLMASAVAAWNGGPVEPYPVRCTLYGGDKPSVNIHRNKS